MLANIPNMCMHAISNRVVCYLGEATLADLSLASSSEDVTETKPAVVINGEEDSHSEGEIMG